MMEQGPTQNEQRLEDIPKVHISDEMKELGEKLVHLDLIQGVKLGDYLRERLGLDRAPDPWRAILDSLNSAGNPLFGGATPMQQQQQQQTQPQGAGAAAGAGAQGGVAGAGGKTAADASKDKATADAAAAAAKTAADDKKSFTLKLEKVDPAKKINLIKELRKLDPTLGIKQAKDLVDVTPSVIKQNLPKDELEKFKKALEGLAELSVE